MEVIFFGIVFTAVVFSCNKRTSNCEFKGKLQTKIMKYGEDNLDFQTAIHEDSAVTIISTCSDEDGLDLIFDIASNYGITMNAEETPLGISIYFEDSLTENENFSTVVPLAVLLYLKHDNRVEAQFYRTENGTLVKKLNYCGITNFFSYTDVIDVMKLNNILSREILNFADFEELNGDPNIDDKTYISDFQKRIDLQFRMNGGGSSSGCSVADPACSDPSEGYCIPKERQSSISAHCKKKNDEECHEEEVAFVLSAAGYTLDNSVDVGLHIVRDSFLSKSFYGQTFIDDWYYSSSILELEDYSFDLAYAAYQVCDLPFINRLQHISDLAYSDSILINDTNKSKLIYLCQQAQLASNDERYQSIINRTVSAINLYTGKTISQIKNDF